MTIARFARLMLLAILAVGLAGLWPSAARAQFDLFGQQPGSSCQIGDNSTVNGTLLGSQLVPGNSNSDPQRLELVRTLTNDPNAVQVACTFETGDDDTSGTWDANGQDVTHLLVKGSTVQQVFAVSPSPKTSGEWSTSCIVNNGGNQPDVSGVFCYRSGDQPPDTATITIEKETVGGLASFDYTLTGPDTDESFSLDTNNGNPVSSGAFTVPATGTEDYEVLEFNLPPNWFPSSPVAASCNHEFTTELNQIENTLKVTIIDVSAGDNIICKFNNEFTGPTGNIRIQKTAIGADETFEYNGTLGQFFIDALNGQTIGQDFNNVEAGITYTITELVPPDWSFADVQCTVDGEPFNAGAGPTIEFDLEADTSVICTFTNEFEGEDGRIIVRKKTIGGDGKFDFELTDQGNDTTSFQLMNGQQRAFELPPGTYMVAETDLPEGWTLQNLDCGGEGERDGNKITLALQSEVTITCTFTNFLENDDPTEDVVKLFINRRVNNLLTHDPDRTRVIRRLDQQRPLHKPMKYAGGEGEAETGGSMSAIESGPAGLPGRGSNTSVFGKSQSGGVFQSAKGSVLPEQDISPSSSHLGHGFAGADAGSSSGGYASAALPFGLSGDFASGQPNGKFSLSLSQVQESAHGRDAKKIADAKAYSNALGLGGNPYGASYDAIPMGLTPNRLDIWAEGHYSHYDDSTGGINRDGDFGILYVGTDYALNDWLLVGALVQFDWTDEDVRDQDLRGGVNGWGWMIGPYMGAKLSDHLYFSARAAWGQSENDITLTDDAAGFRTGDFDTDRWLATAELTGNWYHGPWRFTPSAQIAYGSEDQEAFRNSLNQQIGSNDATVGRLTWGPEIAYRHVMDDGTVVEPLVGIEGVWNFDNDGLRLSDGTPVGDDDFSGKVEGGVLVQMPSGISWRAVGDYYGIGDGDFDSYGGQVWLSVPLN